MKRKRAASVRREDLGKPKFLLRSSRGSQLRALQQRREVAENPPRKKPRQRSMQFLEEIPSFVLEPKESTDTIGDDMSRISESISRRALLRQISSAEARKVVDVDRPKKGSSLMSDDRDTDSDDDVGDSPNVLEGEKTALSAFFEQLGDCDPVAPQPLPTTTTSPPSTTTTTTTPAAPAAEEPVSAKQQFPPPWIQTCMDLDDLRGRTQSPDPASLLFAERLVKKATTDPRGPDPADAPPKDDQAPPPVDQIVCRVQNWVVRMDMVVDRYSVRRALNQARVDLLQRRSLLDHMQRREASPQDYDRCFVARLRQRCGGEGCVKTKDHEASSRPGVPIWDRSVPRVSDLVRRIEKGTDRWCDGTDDPLPPAMDLYDLAYKMQPDGARYDINNFAALKRSTVNPKAACLVYSSTRALAGTRASARVVCTGAKTPEEVAWTLCKLENAILRAGTLPLRIDRQEFKVSNIVASALLPYYVDMDKLARQCRLYCTYTPEAFPGATLRLPQLGHMAVLVYTSKLIITGSKQGNMLVKALRMAIRVTWHARHIDMRSESAQSMLRTQERVLAELLEDARSRCGEIDAQSEQQPPLSPWAAAIGYRSR